MFKRLIVTLLSSLILAILVAPVMADSGLITGSVVNVRSGPGVEYSVAGSLYKNTRVEIITQANGWNKIKYGNLTGWVAESLINIDKVDVRLQVIENTVNLRSGAGTSYALVGQAKKGDILTLIDVQGEWYKVKTSTGSTAYVRSDLVSKIGEQGGETPKDSPATTTPASSSNKQNIPVYLDDRQLSFDVAPIVENQRVLVPLRAIFEAMGAVVEWQQDKSRAVAIKDTTTVILPLNSTHPTINGEQQTIDVPAKVVQQRILAPLRFVGEAFGGEVSWDQAAQTVRIKSARVETPEPTPDPTPTQPTQPELPALHLSSTWEASGAKIIMESDEPLNSEPKTTGNDISYTFSGYKIEGTTSIKQARYITAQAITQGDNVVVNIDIPDGLQYETYTENNGKRVVVSIPNAVLSVDRSTFGSGGEKIGVTALASFKYTSHQDDNQMVIELEGVSPGKARSSYNFSSNLIRSLTVAESTANPENTIITIETTVPAKFALGSSDDGTALYILFIDKAVLQSRVPLVVLDAGHGGKDTGACGYAIEKDVNLDIALKAGEYLTQNGIQVEYTRKDDRFLELTEITDIANLYNAAVFVSVHSNSSVSSSASGTETYYYAPLSRPDLFIQKDERNNLAAKIQNHVVNAINLPDRGVKTANFAVLRNSNMPSALVEVAFISNPIEGSLLAQEDFRSRLGEAIAEGIMEYMRDNGK
ncbi:MAG: N-acetylmuramoyl-L-alanine amidase [Syntrophomonadaceae bacterium]|jgi:N-acetylmuramoyl-L-alanine amidase